VPVAWPWRQQQQDACVGERVDAVALAGFELDQQPGAAVDMLGLVADSDLSAHDQYPGALVNLVLAQAAAGRNLQHDCTAVNPAFEDLRSVRAQRDGL
jgi:hypothetical protein